MSPKASDLIATAPCFNHWVSSSGRFTLRNQKKYHTCYSPVTIITRSILPKHLTFDPAVKTAYFVTSLTSHSTIQPRRWPLLKDCGKCPWCVPG